MESWRRKPRRGILKKDFLGRNLRGGILRGRILEEGFQKGLEGTSESSGATPRSPLKASGASLEPPGPVSGLRGKVS